LIYQIFSRIDSSSDPNRRIGDAFQPVLHNLVCKICIDHPYHGLIQLIALSNGNNVAQTRYANEFSADEKKVEVILQLMQRVKTTAPVYVAELLDSYQIVTNAYIALAMEPTEKFTNKKVTKNVQTKNIQYSSTRIKSRSLWLNKCLHHRSLHMPCVFTAPPHIRPGADYGEGGSDPVGSERIKSFGSTFSLTDTGVHRPKIVVCVGTKGGSYKQLVKGDGM
jgi:ataxia telangiectasia mutated family protein